MKGHRPRVALVVTMVIAALAVPAIAAAGEAQAAQAAPDIVLAGFTSQQYPAFFKIAAAGRSLTLGAIALEMNCTSGSQFVLQDGFGPVRISPSGRFHAAVSIPPTAGSSGVTYSGSDSVTARLGRRHTRVSGTWELTVSYSYPNGMSDRCDSGPVRFTATD